MRIWLTKTHRGFNRLCVALAAVGAFAFVGFNALAGKYRVYKPGERFTVGGTYEQTIKEHVKQQWREWLVNDEHKNRSVSEEYSAKARILKDVQSMKEAKYFSKDKLEKLINQTIKREKEYINWAKTYPQRVWRARGLFARDILGSFIVIFGIGHGVFCLVVWIGQSFRLILLAVGVLTIIGCTEGGSDLYSDASIVSTKKTSVDWVDLHDRAHFWNQASEA